MISHSIGQVQVSTQNTGSAIEDSHLSIQEMASLSQRLGELVSFFKISENKQDKAA